MGKRSKPISTAKFILILILVIIAAVLIGVGIWAVNFMKQVEDPWNLPSPSNGGQATIAPHTTKDPSATNTPDATPTPGGDDSQLIWGKDVINILFIGYDKDTSREDTYTIFRTDTLILLTVYYKENRVVMTSVPRDSYVPIAESFSVKDKINSVPYYAYIQKIDPYEAICSTVSRLFGGVPVEHYMAIDMDVFVEVIDLLGGIEYDVDVDVIYDGKLCIPKGKQLLDGRKALQYVQFRGTATADIGRIARQRRFLTAVFSELKSLDKLSKLPSIYSAVMDKLATNLTYAQVANLLSFASSKLDADAISGSTFPGGFKSGVTYWVIDQNKRVHFIYDMFGISVLPDEQD